MIWGQLKSIWERLKSVLEWLIKYGIPSVLACMLIGMAACIVYVIFYTEAGGTIAQFLGTLNMNAMAMNAMDESKKKTIEFIALGMGGVVATIVAVAVNRRAVAQERNNELIQKGHDNTRFQSIVRDLGHGRVTVRITAFYRFFYLAEKEQGTSEKTKKFRTDVFEILCACLRTISSGTFNPNKSDEYQIEQQALVDVLFKGKFKGNPKKKQNFVSSKFLVKLDGAHLAGLNFSSADLSKANLSGAYLLGANLRKVNLSSADLSGAYLLGANLSSANLSNANLSGAHLSDANLSDANLSDADILGTDISKTKLLGANLSGTNFTGVTFSNVNLSNMNLSGANLAGKDLSSMNLSSMNLSGTNLSNAILRKTNFSKANLSTANLSDTNLSEANFSGANLSGANLSGAKFPDANLSGADLSEANFRKAELRCSQLHNAHSINKADFREAMINGKPITHEHFKEHFPHDKGEYYTDGNPPPKGLARLAIRFRRYICSCIMRLYLKVHHFRRNNHGE